MLAPLCTSAHSSSSRSSHSPCTLSRSSLSPARVHKLAQYPEHQPSPTVPLNPIYHGSHTPTHVATHHWPPTPTPRQGTFQPVLVTVSSTLYLYTCFTKEKISLIVFMSFTNNQTPISDNLAILPEQLKTHPVCFKINPHRISYDTGETNTYKLKNDKSTKN